MLSQRIGWRRYFDVGAETGFNLATADGGVRYEWMPIDEDRLRAGIVRNDGKGFDLP